ncbi:hypothetical protein [uncultured Gammaproteobacteria bacterium]|nr:hypothetical protein [uncultured Gammaproteobacteria bacterium]
MKTIRPYPTPVEIIRSIANALDVKNNGTKFTKDLDDNAFNIHFSYQKIPILVNQLKSSIGSVDEKLANQVSIHLKAALEEYLHTIVATGKNSNDDNRITIFPTLAVFFISKINSFLLDIGLDKALPEKLSLIEKQNSISIALDWLDLNKKDWFVDLKHKEWQDKVYSWKSEKSRPNIQSIKLMAGGQPDIVQLLWVARMLDYLRNITMQYVIHSPKPKHQKTYKRSIDLMRKITALIESNHRDSQIKLKSKKIINLLKETNRGLSNSEGLMYVAHKLDAIWYVLNGDLVNADKYFRKAFEGGLYRSNEIKSIIKLALMIAVYQDKIDKVYIKNLRNAQISFGFSVLNHHKDKVAKALKADDVIQNWQIEQLKLEFDSMFPNSRLFNNVAYPKKVNKTGSVIFIMDKIKPDYKKPNRKIKVGDGGRNKKIPQLVWFVQMNKIEIVKKLLNNGADINLLSESNESAISMALENANIFNARLPNLELFNLISNYKHKKDTLNTRTDKKKLLPIMSAVETGNPDIVRKILEMGANPNILASTDERSALFACLQYIGMLKRDNIKYDLIINKKHTTLQAKDSYMRHGVGNQPTDDSFLDIALNEQAEIIKKYASLSGFYEIAHLLLKFKADPNQNIVFPVKGITPLIYAAELNEGELFKAMLKRGGNIEKAYSCPHDPIRQINCFETAKFYKSEEIMNIIKKIKRR